jgi:hypothetical protein
VREGHRLEIVCERPAIYGLAAPDCEALEATLCEGAPAPCPAAAGEGDNCVVLASVQVLEGGLIVIDDLADRRQLLSQALVQEYLRCRCDESIVPPPPPTPTPPPPPTPTPPPPPTPTPPPPPTRFTFFTFDPGRPTLFTDLPVTQFTQFTRFTDLTLFTDFLPFTEIQPFTDFRPIDPTLPIDPVDPRPIDPLRPVGPLDEIVVVPPVDPAFPIFTGGGPDFDFDRDAFDLDLGRTQPPTAIEGIGPARAERLGELGVRNVLEFAAMSSQVAAEVMNVSEVTVAAMQERARGIMRR